MYSREGAKQHPFYARTIILGPDARLCPVESYQEFILADGQDLSYLLDYSKARDLLHDPNCGLLLAHLYDECLDKSGEDGSAVLVLFIEEITHHVRTVLHVALEPEEGVLQVRTVQYEPGEFILYPY